MPICCSLRYLTPGCFLSPERQKYASSQFDVCVLKIDFDFTQRVFPAFKPVLDLSSDWLSDGIPQGNPDPRPMKFGVTKEKGYPHNPVVFFFEKTKIFSQVCHSEAYGCQNQVKSS